MKRTEIWKRAEECLYMLYGDTPDIRIISRFLSEQQAFAHLGVAEYLDELAEVCRESLEKDNEKLVVKNTIASCFTAYLLGASEINPLQHHYYCKKCKSVEWADEAVCLFDMRSTVNCKCGAVMRADGYDLPYETYIPYAQKLKTKDPVPKNYKDLFEALTKKHFQWSLLGAAQAVNLLGQATGVCPEKIELSDREVKNRLLSFDFSCMNPKLAEFLKQAYTVVQPRNYNELLKLIGMAHGTNTWKFNAEELLMDGKCKLTDLPVTRDEVFTGVRNAVFYDKGIAYDVANKARKGYYSEHGMEDYTIHTLKELGFEDWFASYLLRVRHMSTQALSVMELKYIILLTWYQTYYPKQYAEVIGNETIW